MKNLTLGYLIELNERKGQFIYATNEWFKTIQDVLIQATSCTKRKEIDYTIKYLGVYEGFDFETQSGFQVFENDQIYLVVENRYYLSDYIQAFNMNDLNLNQWFLDEDGYYFTYDEQLALWFEELQDAYNILTLYNKEAPNNDYQDIIDYAYFLENGGVSL